MSLECRSVPPTGTGLAHFDRPTAVLITASNAAATVRQVVRACVTAGAHAILIVDDGSKDATPRVLAELAATAPDATHIRWLRTPRPFGRNAAIRRGLEALRGEAVEAIAIVDGDGRHPIRALPALTTLLTTHHGVVGVPERSGQPLLSRVSGWWADAAFRLLSGLEAGDARAELCVVRKSVSDALAARLPEPAEDAEPLAVLAEYSRERGIHICLAAAPIRLRRVRREPLGLLVAAQRAASAVRDASRLRAALTRPAPALHPA